MKSLVAFTFILFLFLTPNSSAQTVILDAETRLAAAAGAWNEEKVRETVKNLEELKENYSGKETELVKISYLQAFGLYTVVIMNYGQIPDAGQLIGRMNLSIDKAKILDNKLVNSYILKSMLIASGLPPDKAYDQAKPYLDTARMLNQTRENPDITYALATTKLFTQEGAAEILEQAVKEYENVPSRTPIQDYYYWEAQALLADIYNGSFRQEPDFEKSRHYIDEISQNKPEMGYFRHILDAYDGEYEPIKAAEMPKIAWKQGAIDSVGDGRDPAKMLGLTHDYYSIFDAKNVSYSQNNGKTWIRIDYESLPTDNYFGINLLFDVDGDDTNGPKWYGTNNTFRYDLNFTLWLRREGDFWIGLNGAAEGKNSSKRRMTALGEGILDFHLDSENQSLTLSFDSELLGETADEIRMVVAVGSNLFWTDDVPDTGAVLINK